MKYITFVVPCYNSEAYLDRCISSLLVADKDAEIIIINDGSTDRTGKIAHEYQVQYPDIIRVVDQENGGHGSGINRGLALATGIYFMVVDSDDWLDPTALCKLLPRLKSFCTIQVRNQESTIPDLVICNYVNNHLKKGKNHVFRFRNTMHPEEITEWKDIGRFNTAQYFVMHSCIYRTQVLRNCGLNLPEHVYYEDNIFVYQPLPYTRYLYFMDCNLYHYFIGREDQSVSEENLLKHIDDQITVTKLMVNAADLEMIRRQNPRLARYMSRYLSMMFAMTDVLLTSIHTEESEKQLRSLWHWTARTSPYAWRTLHHHPLSALTSLPDPVSRQIALCFYRLARFLYKFN